MRWFFSLIAVLILVVIVVVSYMQEWWSPASLLGKKEQIVEEVICGSTRFQHIFDDRPTRQRDSFGFMGQSNDPAFYNQLRTINAAGQAVTVSIAQISNVFRSTDPTLVGLYEAIGKLDNQAHLNLTPAERTHLIEIGNPLPNHPPDGAEPGTLEYRIDYYSVFIYFSPTMITPDEFAHLKECPGFVSLMENAFTYDSRYPQASPHLFLYQ